MTRCAVASTGARGGLSSAQTDQTLDLSRSSAPLLDVVHHVVREYTRRRSSRRTSTSPSRSPPAPFATRYPRTRRACAPRRPGPRSRRNDSGHTQHGTTAEPLARSNAKSTIHPVAWSLCMPTTALHRSSASRTRPRSGGYGRTRARRRTRTAVAPSSPRRNPNPIEPEREPESSPSRRSRLSKMSLLAAATRRASRGSEARRRPPRASARPPRVRPRRGTEPRRRGPVAMQRRRPRRRRRRRRRSRRTRQVRPRLRRAFAARRRGGAPRARARGPEHAPVRRSPDASFGRLARRFRVFVAGGAPGEPILFSFLGDRSGFCPRASVEPPAAELLLELREPQRRGVDDDGPDVVEVLELERELAFAAADVEHRARA